jgi:hypothetical protein
MLRGGASVLVPAVLDALATPSTLLLSKPPLPERKDAFDQAFMIRECDPGEASDPDEELILGHFSAETEMSHVMPELRPRAAR